MGHKRFLVYIILKSRDGEFHFRIEKVEFWDVCGAVQGLFTNVVHHLRQQSNKYRRSPNDQQYFASVRRGSLFCSVIFKILCKIPMPKRPFGSGVDK